MTTMRIRPSISHAAACALVLIACACGSKDSETPSDQPEVTPPPAFTVKELGLPTPGSGQSQTLFESIAADVSGLTIEPQSQGASDRGLISQGSLILGDVDGDGLEDVFVTNGPGPNQLFLQTEPLTFEEITATATAGVDGGEAWGTGAAFADIDRDRDLDLLVCNYDSPIQCFLNDGTGKFEEKASELGLALQSASLMPLFADYDLDGDLDVYILTNGYSWEGGIPAEATLLSGDHTVIKPEYARWFQIRQMGRQDDTTRFGVYPVGQRDVLLSNTGDGMFVNASDSAGDLCQLSNKGASASWIDFDRDGDLDIYVANEGLDGSWLFRNAGDGTFQNITESALPYTLWFARGTAMADIEEDGFMDLISMANPPPPRQTPNLMGLARLADPPPIARPVLWQNAGDDFFREVALPFEFTPHHDTWGVLLGDFDQDGTVDALASSESGLQAWKGKQGHGAAEGIIFEVTTTPWGFGESAPGTVLAKADLDADGDLDVLSRTLEGTVQLYHNTSIGGSRVLVQLISSGDNYPATGARIELRSSDRTLVKVVAPGNGFQAGHGFAVPFSFPPGAEEIDSLMVLWPSGAQVQKFNLPLHSHIQIVEPEEKSERDLSSARNRCSRPRQLPPT